jgi:membrane associated rhomboid family serine protease
MRKTSNPTLLYLITLLAIVLVFVLVGKSTMANEMTNDNNMMNISNIKWLQILIGVAIGFLMGIFYYRRKW